MSFPQSLKQIIPVSRETEESLSIYVDTLLQWQKKINLISPSTIDEIWVRHVADSLHCLAVAPDKRHWLDLGSGGGFPGLVIAAGMKGYADSSITLIESNSKKASFLRHANRRMGTSANIVESRIEAVQSIHPAPQIVTARALAGLPKLLSLSARWLDEGATGLFYKGEDYERELDSCNNISTYHIEIHPSPVRAGSALLEFRKRE